MQQPTPSMSLAPNPASQHGPCGNRRKACENCRRRKERCDGFQPCSRCRKRKVEGECVLRVSRMMENTQPKRARRSSHRGDGKRKSVDHFYMPAIYQQSNTQSYRSPSPTQERLPDRISLEPTMSYTPRPPRNRHGEHLFFGASANLAFLQTIRQVVHRALGPCSFANNELDPDLVDDEQIAWPEVLVEPARPSRDDTQYFLRWYARANSCVFDLFSYEELVTDILPWVEGNPISGDARSCINFLVLAIGAQCAPQDHDEESRVYFSYGRSLASRQLLETSSICMVQVYCLISMYLLNMSCRTAANMHLGVAIRAAYSLGIHRADDSKLYSEEENAKRERIWKVLRVLDLFLSTSLGQRPATAETRDTLSQKEYSASTDLCYIFEKILTEIYTKQAVSSSVLERVSKHHREWAAHFHDGLRVDRISPEECLGTDLDKKLPNIGLCHLKEAYYWTIMLVTRPYLTDLVQNRISRLTDFNSIAEHSSQPPDTLLAHAAVNSAILTVDLLQSLIGAEEVPRRLPYVVNSVFISALVLGMGFFADLDRLFPLESTLFKAQQLLDRFGRFDALAKWSFNVVQGLRRVCDDYVNQRHDRWLRHQRALVEGMFGDVKIHPLLQEQLGEVASSPDENAGISTDVPKSPGLLVSSPDLDESNTIWGQLFWNGRPNQLCELDTTATDSREWL